CLLSACQSPHATQKRQTCRNRTTVNEATAKSVEFHGFQILGIPGNRRNSADFLTPRPDGLRACCAKMEEFYPFSQIRPRNAQLSAFPFIGGVGQRCCGALGGATPSF